MSRTYYVIELTPRWLAILLFLLVALVVLAFVGGYGAAWSTLGGGSRVPAASAAAPTGIPEVEIAESEPDEVVASVATPVPPKPTVTPAAGVAEAAATPTAKPTEPAATATEAPSVEAPATAVPSPAATPFPRPRAEPDGFWVQVMAVSHQEAVEKGREKVADAGFPKRNQKIVESPVAGGGRLFKLWVGPFPDLESANRVRERMQRSGFPDAWVVTP